MIGIPEAKMSDVAQNANLTIGTDQRRSKYSRNKKIKIGDKFGRWTVIGFDKKVTWKAICVCMCGNKKSVLKSSLNNKSSKSCGCIAAEINRERMYKHGMASHINPTYNVWTNMIARCHRKTHPQYRLYGSRGIEVCERWKSNYTNFLEDMGEKPYN